MTVLTLTLVSVLASQAPLSAEEQLQGAKAAYAELEYEQAASEMMLVATRDDATEAQKVEANLYAGMANVIMAREVRARLNFRYALARQPDLALPEGTSPKVASFFALVQEEIKSEQRAAPTATDGPGAAPVDDVATPVSPAPAPATAAPEASAPEAMAGEASSFPWLLSIGALVTGGSVVLTGVTLATALIIEGIYADPSSSIGSREGALILGPALWVGVALGAIATAAGAGLVVWGVLE